MTKQCHGIGGKCMEKRISEHPILGEYEKGKLVTFLYNGQPLEGFEGEPIAAALMAAGVMVQIGRASCRERGSPPV